MISKNISNNSKNNINLKESEIKELLINPIHGARDHFVCDCPFCSKTKHFYFNYKNYLWDCKKCGESGGALKLLQHLGKHIEFLKPDVELGDVLHEIDDEEVVEDEIEMVESPTKLLPVGFKRVYGNDYLKSRHFKKIDFQKNCIGVTNLKEKYKHYVLFSIEEDNQCRGFVGRCILPNEEAEEQGLKRYENSRDTKFNNLLFGYDSITNQTKTVILVEGLFDAVRINSFFDFYNSDETKCCATFGKKISPLQIMKLKKKGVENIILVYDADAVKEINKYAGILKNQFKDVKIGFFPIGEDASSSNNETILKVFSNLHTVGQFFLNTIQKMK